MDKESRLQALEKSHVHDVYNSTAGHLARVRHRPWPKVKQFLQSLEPGSLVADIGCGNGRYLNINPMIYKLGSDRCEGLVESSNEQGHEVMICDNLHLPYRDGCFDAVISIGVIHHMITKSRRVRALRELARIIRPSGKVMIYVWAMEQKHRKFESQDVLVPWNFHHKNLPSKDNASLDDDTKDEKKTNHTSSSLFPPAKNSLLKQQPQSTSEHMTYNHHLLGKSQSLDDKRCKCSPRKSKNQFLKFFSLQTSDDEAEKNKCMSCQMATKLDSDEVKTRNHLLGDVKPANSGIKTADQTEAVLNSNHKPVLEDSGLESLNSTSDSADKEANYKYPISENGDSNEKPFKLKFLNILSNAFSQSKDQSEEPSHTDPSPKLPPFSKNMKFDDLLEYVKQEEALILNYNKQALGQTKSMPIYDEVFAVREFPQSSRNLAETKHGSMKEETACKDYSVSHLNCDCRGLEVNSSACHWDKADDTNLPNQAHSPSGTTHDKGDEGFSYNQNYSSDKNDFEILGSCESLVKNDKKESFICDKIRDNNYEIEDIQNRINDSLENHNFTENTSPLIVDSGDESVEVDIVFEDTQESSSDETQSSGIKATSTPDEMEADSEDWESVTEKAIQAVEEQMKKCNAGKSAMKHKHLWRGRTSAEVNGSRQSSLPSSGSEVSLVSIQNVKRCDTWSIGSDALSDSTFSEIEDDPSVNKELMNGNSGAFENESKQSEEFNDVVFNADSVDETANIKESGKQSESKTSASLEESDDIEVDMSMCHRYYHVYKEGELVDLIQKYVDTLQVVECSYDHANWCVVAEKIQVWRI